MLADCPRVGGEGELGRGEEIERGSCRVAERASGAAWAAGGGEEVGTECFVRVQLQMERLLDK